MSFSRWLRPSYLIPLVALTGALATTGCQSDDANSPLPPPDAGADHTAASDAGDAASNEEAASSEAASSAEASAEAASSADASEAAAPEAGGEAGASDAQTDGGDAAPEE